MPLYDMKCERCEKITEVFCKLSDWESQTCECGGHLKAQVTGVHSQDWFKPHWNPNFGLQPVYVESRGHMKQLCKQFNVTSRALGDVRNISEI